VKKSTILRAAPILALAGALSCAAQDKGYWQAASTTANSITGDISISESKVSINFVSFPVVKVRSLVPAEVSAVFDSDISAGGTGVLYRLSVPASKHFLHHNSLCGTEETQWMATFASGHTLQVAFFSGTNAPEFTFDAISKSTDLCGTYTYAR
jgi:hypothetical protein